MFEKCKKYINDKKFKQQQLKNQKKVEKAAQCAALLNEERKKIIQSNIGEDFNKPTPEPKKEDFFLKISKEFFNSDKFKEVEQNIKKEQKDEQVSTATSKNSINISNMRPGYQSNYGYGDSWNTDRNRSAMNFFYESRAPLYYTPFFKEYFEKAYDTEIYVKRILEIPVYFSFGGLNFFFTKKTIPVQYDKTDNEKSEDVAKKEEINVDISHLKSMLIKAIIVCEIRGGCAVEYKDNEDEIFKIEKNVDKNKKENDNYFIMHSHNKPKYQGCGCEYGLSFYEDKMEIMQRIKTLYKALYQAIQTANSRILSQRALTSSVTGEPWMPTAEQKKEQDEFLQKMNENLNFANLVSEPYGSEIRNFNEHLEVDAYLEGIYHAEEIATEGVSVGILKGQSTGAINIGGDQNQNLLSSQMLLKFRSNYESAVLWFMEKLANKYNDYVFSFAYEDFTTKEKMQVSQSAKDIAEAISTLSNAGVEIDDDLKKDAQELVTKQVKNS